MFGRIKRQIRRQYNARAERRRSAASDVLNDERHMKRHRQVRLRRPAEHDLIEADGALQVGLRNERARRGCEDDQCDRKIFYHGNPQRVSGCSLVSGIERYQCGEEDSSGVKKHDHINVIIAD